MQWGWNLKQFVWADGWVWAHGWSLINVCRMTCISGVFSLLPSMGGGILSYPVELGLFLPCSLPLPLDFYSCWAVRKEDAIRPIPPSRELTSLSQSFFWC